MTTPTTDIAKRTPMQQVLVEVASDNFIAKIQNALPEKISPQRFVSVTVTAIKQNPELITADRDSLYNSVLRCAQDGLMPDGREAALVIFKSKDGKKAQYMPMIGGYRKIAAKYGISLVADVVRKGDHFKASKVPPRLEHTPAPFASERGEVIGAYAVALYPNGRLVTAPALMTPDEIERVRSVSRAANSEYGPWVQWWDRMAAKTVARRLFAELPLGELDEQTASIIAASDAEYDLPPADPSMNEAEANVLAAVSNLSPADDEETHLREEPAAPISDSQLNRIANLEKALGEDAAALANASLLGVFGVSSAEHLAGEDAERYESMLRAYLQSQTGTSESVSEVIEDAVVVEEEPSFEDMVPESVKKQTRGRTA